jgi:hypothetical protein
VDFQGYYCHMEVRISVDHLAGNNSERSLIFWSLRIALFLSSRIIFSISPRSIIIASDGY